MRYTKTPWLIILLALSLSLSACNIGQEAEPTIDVGAVFTAAAETVQAQFASQQTQTALAMPTATQPPTATPVAENSPAAPLIVPSADAQASPLPTFGVAGQPTPFGTLSVSTPLVPLATQAGPVCLSSTYIQDVTYEDTVEKPTLKAGDRVLKIWRIQNSGTCAWEAGFALVQWGGDNMQANKYEIYYPKEYVDPGEMVNISLEMNVPTTKGEHGGCWKMRDDKGAYFGTDLCFNFIVK